MNITGLKTKNTNIILKKTHKNCLNYVENIDYSKKYQFGHFIYKKNEKHF